GLITHDSVPGSELDAAAAGVEKTAIAARFFGGIEGGIRPLDERNRRFASNRLSRSRADGDPHAPAVDAELGGFDRATNPLHAVGDLRKFSCRKEERKFLAAVARHEVGVPHSLF